MLGFLSNLGLARESPSAGRTTMKSAWLVAAGLALVLLPTTGRSQQMDFDKVQIITEKLGTNVYMLTGSGGLDPSHDDAAGGRIGVLAGPDGILMIDSQYAQLGDKVLAAVKKIDGGPIRFLVNTHIHRDHTAGNAFFARQGAVIFAREELRDGMVRLSQGPNAAGNPVANPAGFPVVTYGMGPPVKIHMNGETSSRSGRRTPAATPTSSSRRRTCCSSATSTATTATRSSTSTMAGRSRACWRGSISPCSPPTTVRRSCRVTARSSSATPSCPIAR
jgi:hypothetical protein